MGLKGAVPTLERFTVLLYSRSSNALTANECSRGLFCQGSTIDNILPTGAALWKHGLRAVYYEGHVWGLSLMAIQVLPPPEEWGWKYDSGKSIPYWTDLPETSSAVRGLIKFRCNPEKGCRGRCKCVNALPLCTELCMCKAECERDDRSQ